MRNKLTVLAVILFLFTGISTAQTHWYVNDNSTTNDILTTATGDNGNSGNSGTSSAPFATITFALSSAVNGDIIHVDAGTYIENVNVNKIVTLIGAGSANTIIIATNANSSPLTISASGAVVNGLTLTHDYTPAELTAWNFNNNGVTFSQGISGSTLTNCTVTLSRNGIYLNNTQNNIISNCVIDNNRTGINATNNFSGTQITGNTISNNWTIGFVSYANSFPTDYSTVVITGNTFDSNWYTEILIKDAALNTGILDVTNNTFTDSPVTYSTSSNVEFNEPGFADLKPNVPEIGGSDTMPAEELPTLRIYNSGLVVLKYDDLKTILVDNGQPIQDAINFAENGDVINIDPGTYPAITIDKPITLIGGPGAKIDSGSPAITVNSTGVIIQGFIFDFDAPDYAVDVLNGAYNVDISLNRFLNVDGINIGNGVRNQGTGVVNSINNYWNSNTGPTIGSNPGGVGNTAANTGGGTLSYSPWYLYSGAQLDYPANLSVSIPITPNFQWSWPWLGSATYTIEVATDAVFTNIVYGPVPATSPHQLPLIDALNNGTQYYWRITADDGFDIYTSVASFTTIAVPPPVLTTPANYSVGVTVMPSFEWTGIGTSYEFLIDNNSDFSSPVAAYSGANTTFDFLPYVSTATEVLANGTLYYWRVRQTTIDGTSPWAQNEFTTVNAAVPVITTLYPSGNTCNVAWYPSPYASGLKYDILLSTNSDMTAFTTPATGLTDTNYNLTGLSAGTTYYIQIVSYTGVGPYVYYSFSPVSSFTTPGVPPVYLSYPTGGSVVYFNPVTVYYYTGTYSVGLQYEVRYSLSSSVDGFGMLNSGASSLPLTSSLFATLPVLTAGQTYYWQVRAYDGFTYGSWSSVENFSIYSSTPSTPIVPYPSYPTTGSIVYLNPPTFYWYLGTYATGLEFYVEWDDASNFLTPLGNSGWITNLYFTLPSNLTPGQTYYWHVKSRLASPPNTESLYSSTQDFTMALTANGGAAQPYPASPAGGTNVGTPLASTQFSWSVFTAVTLEYQVRISPYSSADGNGMLNHPTAVSSGWVSGTTITAGSIPFSLTAGATYYWQVRSRLQASPAVMSSWSYVTFFVTAAGSFAIVPMVGSPSHGQPINSSSAVLTWRIPTESETHLKYDVEYSKDAQFNYALKVEDVNEPVVSISGLDSKSTYYWRVLSKNASGSISDYSETGSFTTDASITDAEDIEKLPTTFALEQNYPNPFNPTTQIAYSIPENLFVTLRVYDMLGREVKTLVNQAMSAGRFTINWNGEDNFGNKVASGTYIYRIVTSKFVTSKKMLLIK